MSVLNSVLDEIEQQAVAMGDEIKAQSPQLDRIDANMEKHQARVAKQTKATASVGGKEAKKAARNEDLEGAAEAMQRAAQRGVQQSARMAALQAMRNA